MAKKRPKTWVYSPPKPVRAEVESRAQQFLEAELKPKYLKPPPKDARFNYLVDITCKWHGWFFYIVGVFACPGPNALSPSFESKLARMLPVAPDRYVLSFQRHTGQWIDLFRGLSLQQYLETVRDEPWFMPV